MATTTVKMTGLPELKAKLKAMSYETRYKGGRSALRKAGMVAVKAAQQNARALDDADTGRTIADNVALRWNGRVYKATGNLAFRIGVMKGAVTPKKGEKVDFSANGPTPHWRLLEFGTERSAARPFLRPAFEGNLQAMTDVFIKQYSLAIDRAIKKGRT